MALFSKNKPTKRVNFEGGWVELQYLSQGVKDEIQSRLAGLYKDLEKFDVNKLKDSESIPDGINLNVIKKINEVEYYKLSKAIKAWSESDLSISEESVQELDGDVFQKISAEINKMNTLDQEQRKN